jgi:hypothetical protein
MIFSIFSIGRVANRFDVSYIKTVNADDFISAMKFTIGSKFQSKNGGYDLWKFNNDHFFLSRKQISCAYKSDPLVLTHVGWLVKNITPNVEKIVDSIANKIINKE